MANVDKITLLAPVTGIPIVYPFEGYGGIERIVADLAVALHKAGVQVEVIASPESHIPDVKVRFINNEAEYKDLPPFKGVIIDFSHRKHYKYSDYSVPFLTDAVGRNPIFPTKFVKDLFLRSNPSLISKDAPVIYPGIEITNYLNAKKMNTDKEYFVFLSRIAQYKGTGEVIRHAKRYDLLLKIAGSTGQFAGNSSYIDFIKKEIKDTNIEFIGDVTEEQKIDLLVNSCGVIAYPMWYLLGPSLGESFGIFAVEALASGVPVWLPKEPNGTNELLDSTCGVFFDPMNMSKDVFDFRAKAEDCRQRAMRYSATQYALDLIEYIRGK
ncbi:MAG: glycosyltransferase [Thermoplasmataceae archaeon]